MNRDHLSVRLHIAIAVLLSLIASLATLQPASAQVDPQIHVVDYEDQGLDVTVYVDPTDYYQIRATGFTPDSTITGYGYGSADNCSGDYDTVHPLESTLQGEAGILTLVHPMFPLKSWKIVDDATGLESPCLVMRGELRPAASLTYNGSSSPATAYLSDAPFTVGGTGFAHGDTGLTWTLYSTADCSGTGTAATVASDAEGNATQDLPITAVGTYSVSAASDYMNGSNCLNINVIDEAGATQTAEAAPTQTAEAAVTQTAESQVTAEPTVDETPVTDETPTLEPSTEPTVEPSTEPGATTVADTGDAAVTFTTPDGEPFPDGALGCMDETCESLDEAAFSGAAAPSGTTVLFTGLSAGTHAVTVVVGDQSFSAGSITVVAGEVTSHTIVASVAVDGPATPVTEPTTPAGAEPTAAPPVVQLPSTGTGYSATPSIMIVLIGALALATVAVASLRRRQMR